MTFEEWYSDFLHYEGEPTKDIAKQAWEAAMEEAHKAGVHDLVKAHQIRPRGKSMLAYLPEGYVLVPVEPTEKMVEAGYNAYVNSGWIRTYEIYEAMIQAAQEIE